MIRLRGLAPLAALLAMTMAGSVQAAVTYEIVVDIVDHTTSSNSHSYTITSTSPLNTSTTPNSIVAGNLNTSSTGVTISGLSSTTTLGANSTSLDIGGTAAFAAGNSDSYTITVTTSESGLTSPTAKNAVLNQSESGTYTNSTGGTQTFQSYYQSPGTLGTPAGTTPGVQTITIPVTTTTQSGNANTPALVAVSPYMVPYTLTNVLVINTSGNDKSSNSGIGFHGSSILASAVPEPASIIMMLTGMPVPLVILGILRRRRKAVANF
jgi:hypothetical protein